VSTLTFEHYSQKVMDRFLAATSQTAITDFLGIRFTEGGPGRLVAELDVRAELVTMMGSAHGGVVAVLIDHVLGSVMYPVMPRGWWAATTEYKINNLAPIRGGNLRAEANVVAMTKRTSVVRIDVTNDGRLCSIAQGTCLLQEPKPKEA
jgi:1,4-dihydroxy-2-naphthoyl-CoA hydrolase